MRIVSWNINGVRTLPQYHPWNSLKNFDDILNHLEADIICFQEMKSSRQNLPKQTSLPPSFHSFFSFPIQKTGYSGTAIYTRSSTVVPLKAEEGLTGLMQPTKPPLSPEERISKPGTYPPDIAYLEDDDEGEALDFKDLDREGRAVVLDLGLFVLINTYCPNSSSSEDRHKFKKSYHHLLSTRVAGLVKEGREVIVVGDLNSCAAIIDHCEGALMVKKGLQEGLKGEEGFWGKADNEERESMGEEAGRGWLSNWLVKDGDCNVNGKMVDITRKFWPDRKGMYTCWNTKISARETNYGTRIDYILVTPCLLPWVKASDIQPHIKGSDHCPVFVDLHDEITNEDGTATKLRNVLGLQGDPDENEPPRLAAKFWDEHKQKLLSTFFLKGKKSASLSAEVINTFSSTPSVATSSTLVYSGENIQKALSTSSILDMPETPQVPEPSLSPSASVVESRSLSVISETSQSHSLPPDFPSVPSSSIEIPKRKLIVEGETTVIKKPKLASSKRKERKKEVKVAQSSLVSFFPRQNGTSSATSQNNGGTSASSSKILVKSKIAQYESAPPDLTATKLIENTADITQDVDEDYQYALMLSQSSENVLTSQSQSQSESALAPSEEKESSKRQAWTTLLAPTQAPKCTVHQEPAKEYTVNKPGKNKGKRFFICSRPVGPGYDRGRAERPRDQVDPQWKCDFFKWSSEVRKEMNKTL